MPYRCVGKDLYHRVDGHWKLKQHTKTKSNCEVALRLLEGLKSGSIKKNDISKSRIARKIRG